MITNGFTTQWAIRLPNGQLYSYATTPEPVEDFSISSPMRDMFSFFSMGTAAPSTSPPAQTGPVVFRTEKEAEAKRAELVARAAAVGVEMWGGVVVSRMCTPFTSGDPSVDFANAIVGWLEQQAGAS